MVCGCIQIKVGIDMAKWKPTSDKSAEISQSQLWAMLEATGGFLVACLPVMPKFTKALWHTVSGSAFIARFPTFPRDTHGGDYGGSSDKEVLTI
jgi:methionyl-tRNA synthetase